MDRRTAVFLFRAAGATICMIASGLSAYAIGFGPAPAFAQWLGVFAVFAGVGSAVLWCGACLAATGDYWR